MSQAWIADIGQIIFADIILSGEGVLVIAPMAFFASLIIKITNKVRWLFCTSLSFLIYSTGMMLKDEIRELGEVV